ncbi:MAG: RsmB/NOP family class I SAM-dependent RNA methyltransferase [Roseovarius sp.]|nr:RsmB/NOP family class I SAM-dependent RNA methyltransferase [Roseovarius sp.]
MIDEIREGAPAERALTNWARRARYAGSKDRAAVRDHVYDVIRRWRSCGALGGGAEARALVIGLLRGQGVDPDEIFTGEGYAPPPLSKAERAAGYAPRADEARDLPDWLWLRFQASLGAEAGEAAETLRHRAPVTLRVNARRMSRDAAQVALADEGILCQPVNHVKMALQVIEGSRKISSSPLYLSGAIELQDASSQAAMETLELQPRSRVLDYCAGGGGKTLALAARVEGEWFAHDVSMRRMSDLPARAARAGAEVRLCETQELHRLGPYDAVLCDVPCSGSGTWRRGPQAKWDLTPEDLVDLSLVQGEILAQASALVAPGGQLIYCTCSVLCEENECVIQRFSRNVPGWHWMAPKRWLISEAGDGFFLAQLFRERSDFYQP